MPFGFTVHILRCSMSYNENKNWASYLLSTTGPSESRSILSYIDAKKLPTSWATCLKEIIFCMVI